MKEYEVKKLLSKEEYDNLNERLLSKYKGERYIQINYYYDTDNLKLFNSFKTLRVRQIEDQLKLEYKYNRKTVGSTKICDEYAEQLKKLPECLKNPIEKNDDIYFNLGNLVTERTDYVIEKFRVSIDKSYYFGTIDYEIEIESDDVIDTEEVYNKFGINFSEKVTGKYARFINKLKENQ